MNPACFLLLIFLLISDAMSAQRFSDLPISVTYFGENLFHPGVKAGILYPLSEKEKIKQRWLFKQNNQKDIRSQYFISGNLGFYNHANNHSAFFVQSELLWRKVKWHRKGNFWGLGLGVGYLRRSYNIPVYQLGSNDEVNHAGKNQFLGNFSIEFGRDLRAKRNIPLTWQVKPSLMMIAPYGHTAVLNAALELGITYPFFSKK
jgi:hypothetical protein